MKPSALIIIILICGVMIWKGCYHPKFPEVATEYLKTYTSVESQDIVVTPKPCAGRDHCVYIYVAPWCPHCRDLISYIQDYRKFWKSQDRPGLMVIVGNDKKPAIEQMAMRIGAPVFLDSDDRFRKALHVNFFPYYMVINAKGEILATRTDAMSWVDREINTHLKQK